MGLAQGGEQCLGHRCLAIAPAGNDDGPGLFEQFQAAIGQHLDATHGAHRALIDGGDLMLYQGKSNSGRARPKISTAMPNSNVQRPS